MWWCWAALPWRWRRAVKKAALGLERDHAVAIGIDTRIGIAARATQAGVAVDQVQVDAQPGPRQLQRPIGKGIHLAAIANGERRAQAVVGELDGEVDVEHRQMAEVGEQRARAVVVVVAQRPAEAAAQHRNPPYRA